MMMMMMMMIMMTVMMMMMMMMVMMTTSTMKFHERLINIGRITHALSVRVQSTNATNNCTLRIERLQTSHCRLLFTAELAMKRPGRGWQ